MTAPGEGMTERSFHPVQFILLCLLVGPAVGFVSVEFAYWLQPTTLSRAPLFAHLQNRENWFVAYWLGGILAIVTAVIFLLIRYKFGFSGLGTAILSASVIPAIRTLSEVVQGSFVGGLSELFYGILHYIAICVVPMSICWLVARAFRII
jgi:hypothetical protein